MSHAADDITTGKTLRNVGHPHPQSSLRPHQQQRGIQIPRSGIRSAPQTDSSAYEKDERGSQGASVQLIFIFEGAVRRVPLTATSLAFLTKPPTPSKIIAGGSVFPRGWALSQAPWAVTKPFFPLEDGDIADSMLQIVFDDMTRYLSTRAAVTIT